MFVTLHLVDLVSKEGLSLCHCHPARKLLLYASCIFCSCTQLVHYKLVLTESMLQLAFAMHLVEGSDDPMQILKDLTAQRQRVLGRQGLFGYEARFKSKDCQTGRPLRTSFDVFRHGNGLCSAMPFLFCIWFLTVEDFAAACLYLICKQPILPDPIPDPEPIIIGNLGCSTSLMSLLLAWLGRQQCDRA